MRTDNRGRWTLKHADLGPDFMALVKKAALRQGQTVGSFVLDTHEQEQHSAAEPDHAHLADLLAAHERAARAEGELAGLREALARADVTLAAERSRGEGECTALRAQVAVLQAALADARKGWLERLIEAVRKS